MPGQIAFLLEHRKRTLGDEPIDLGTIAERLYVGDPGWDIGEPTLSGRARAAGGTAQRVRGHGREPRADPVPQPLSLAELLDQMDAFRRDVAPLLSALTATAWSLTAVP